MGLDARIVSWLTQERGITEATAEAFGWKTDGTDLIIPYTPEVSKTRWAKDRETNPFGLLKEGRMFTWSGAGNAGQFPYLTPDWTLQPKVILVEGETDTMRLWQAGVPEGYCIVGLSGLAAWKSRYVEELIPSAERVFVVMDNDDPYDNPNAHEAGEKAWKRIREDLGSKARRVKLPQGTNDLCEFFNAYQDFSVFEVLLDAANAPIRHYRRLDLTQPVPAVNWVVEDMIEAGVVTVLTGDGGVGKSFLTMALAMSIAQGRPFLGRAVKKGPVQYVDEEQSPDMVLQRMQALGRGMDVKEWYTDIDYLNYAGVNLHQEPEKLLDEVIDAKPTALFLDTLTAVTVGLNENENWEMTKLMVEGMRPLARLSGSAVVVLHHTSKDTFNRPRGASAIRNMADQVLSITEEKVGDQGLGVLNIFASKPRREMQRVQCILEGHMKTDGYVRVISPYDNEVL